MRKLAHILSNSKLKYIIIFIILFSIYALICAFSYANAVSEDIAQSVFRLHVIANSDSKEDQDLKYKVRDQLINYMNTLAKDANSKKEVIEIAKQHSEEFRQIVKQTILDNGFVYDATVQIGNFTFPTKQYGDISLPAGDYDALRIEIGSAKGQNWWCVMFPPLCFVDVSTGIVPEESKEVIKSNLSEEEYTLVSQGNNEKSDNNEIKLKFKLLELFQNTKTETAKK